jgi:hypothetical protein
MDTNRICTCDTIYLHYHVGLDEDMRGNVWDKYGEEGGHADTYKVESQHPDEYSTLLPKQCI